MREMCRSPRSRYSSRVALDAAKLALPKQKGVFVRRKEARNRGSESFHIARSDTATCHQEAYHFEVFGAEHHFL